MRYNGGKKRLGPKIAAIINAYKPKMYWEPFCGMCGVGAHVKASERLFTDCSQSLVAVLSAAMNGFDFPEQVTEQDYQSAKLLPETDPLHGFCKWGCSFGAKPWGGYARGEGRNFPKESAKAMKKLASKLAGSTIGHANYKDVSYSPDLIYCDPPYAGTTKCGDADCFDTAGFWSWVRERSKTATVLVSEYAAPEDFECIWQAEVSGLKRSDGTKNVEKLWRIKK